MRVNRYRILLVLFLLVAYMPLSAQRFTKKEQALREARAINYFYGHSFTLSAGYVHGWLLGDHFEDDTFGRTGSYQNKRESYAFSFDWDICKKKTHGYQFGLDFVQLGGSKIFFEDLGLGYGKQQRHDLTEQIHLNELMLTGAYRYFIPLTYESRLSLNGGIYVSRILGSYDDAKDWDLGAFVSIGFDYKHWSASVRYYPGVYGNVIDDSTARVAGLSLSIGYHLWK